MAHKPQVGRIARLQTQRLGPLLGVVPLKSCQPHPQLRAGLQACMLHSFHTWNVKVPSSSERALLTAASFAEGVCSADGRDRAPPWLCSEHPSRWGRAGWHSMRLLPTRPCDMLSGPAHLCAHWSTRRGYLRPGVTCL